MQWTMNGVLATMLALGLVASAQAQVPGKIPNVDELSRGIYRTRDGRSGLAVKNMFGMGAIVSTKEMIENKMAPPWFMSVLPGDAAILATDGRDKFKNLVDYPAQGNQVTYRTIQDYIGTYRYDTRDQASFDASKAKLIEFVRNHRSKRFWSVGLPIFAWDRENGLASTEKQIKGPLVLFNANPVNTAAAPYKNGVVDKDAMLAGIRDCILAGQGGFLNRAGITVSEIDGKKYYDFGDGKKYAFEAFQCFLFQKTPMGNTVESVNNNPERWKTAADVEGWNLPRVKSGVTDYDAVPMAEHDAARAAFQSMVASQKYTVVACNGADSNNLTDYKPIDIANPNTWTVEHQLSERVRFDPGLEGDNSVAAQKRQATPLEEMSKSWMEVVSYTDGNIIDEQGNKTRVGPYLFTQYVYVQGALTFIPETLAQARMVATNSAPAPAYQPAAGDFGVRSYTAPRFNVEFGDEITDFSKPVRMYRGYPSLGSGETLVGANDAGEILIADQVNQDSTLCMNMALSLATRYRYNPNPQAPPAPPPPQNPADMQAYLDTYFPVCISYYPPYNNNRGELIGPYVRLAGPVPGMADPGPDRFADDRYRATDRIPGTQTLMGTLYRPIKFEGPLLEVVNFLCLPDGHPNKPAGQLSYGAEFLTTRGYRYAWALDFDQNSDPDQGVEDGFSCEVIRIPLVPPKLSFVSEVLPIDPRLPTMEQQDADGTVHKALLDAKLRNGPGIGNNTLQEADLDTNRPGYGRNNFIYAVVGQCCGPTVLLQATMAQGNRVREIGGTKQQVGPRPSSILVLTSEQGNSSGTKQEEALGIPAGFEAKGPPGFAVTGSPALKGSYRLDSISSRAGDDYQFGQYSNLAPEIGFDRGAPGAGNAMNPSDAKGKSFLEAQGTYVAGQRYFLDVCAETAVSPQIVDGTGVAGLTPGPVVAYFVKKMKLDIFAPGKTEPDTSQILYSVKDLKTPPSQPPCSKYEFVPRQIGDYTMVTSITDFNDITRVTRMRVPVRDSGVDVNAINSERERK